MDLGIAGRVALVTGGSRGLGRHAALSLAREGVHVAICARGQETLEQTAAELRALKVKTVAIAADVTQPADTRRVFDEVTSTLGKLDILVNNVGGSRGADFENTSEEQIEETFRLNLFGALRLTRLAIPGMRGRRWGRIVTISSIYGREHGGGFAYMTAKAALIAATKSLALRLAKDGITANSVAPGSIIFPGGGWERFTQTQPQPVVDDFIKNNLPMGRFGWPQPVGDLVAYLASQRADLITGACINIDGGQSRSLI